MIRVIIVDDHQAITEGLEAELDATSDIRVVGTAIDGVSGEALIRHVSPDVVLCDIDLKTAGEGLDLVADHPDQSFIMLTAHLQPTCVVTAMMRGARGYRPKMATIEEIIESIRTVAGGGNASSMRLGRRSGNPEECRRRSRKPAWLDPP